MNDCRDELLYTIRYDCHLCESSFSRRNNLSQHKFKIHGVLKRKYTKLKPEPEPEPEPDNMEKEPKGPTKKAIKLSQEFKKFGMDKFQMKKVITSTLHEDVNAILSDLTDISRVDDLQLMQLATNISNKNENGVTLSQDFIRHLNSLTDDQRELAIYEIEHRELSTNKKIRTAVNELFSSTESHSLGTTLTPPKDFEPLPQSRSPSPAMVSIPTAVSASPAPPSSSSSSSSASPSSSSSLTGSFINSYLGLSK